MTIYVETAQIFSTPQTNIAVINSVTGRPEVLDTGVEESMSVSLEQRSTEPMLITYKGKDVSGLFCRGRVLPIGNTYPTWYTPDNDFKIIWSDGREGRFYSKHFVPSRFELYTVFGLPLQGVFVQRSQNN